MNREFVMLPIPVEHYDAVVRFLADGCPQPKERPHRRVGKGGTRSVTDEEIGQMRALRETGLSLEKIGRQFDASPGTVFRYTQDIPSPRPGYNSSRRSRLAESV